jgi:hypothetical protein
MEIKTGGIEMITKLFGFYMNLETMRELLKVITSRYIKLYNLHRKMQLLQLDPKIVYFEPTKDMQESKLLSQEMKALGIDPIDENKMEQIQASEFEPSYTSFTVELKGVVGCQCKQKPESAYPRRFGERWTKEERKALHNSFLLFCKKAASVHERTETAIFLELDRNFRTSRLDNED